VVDVRLRSKLVVTSADRNFLVMVCTVLIGPRKAGGFPLETSARSEGEAVVETKKPSNPAKSRE
jgi:hypothetical protein